MGWNNSKKGICPEGGYTVQEYLPVTWLLQRKQET